MKKILFLASTCALTLIMSCNDAKKEEAVHMHDDGSTHAAHDTTAPVQQEFNVIDTLKKDTTHAHKDGENHSH